MNIAEKIEARIKAFFNKPIPDISLGHFLLLMFALLAVGSFAGMFRPFVAWLFILTFILLGLAFLIPYLQRKRGSTEGCVFILFVLPKKRKEGE